MMTFMMQKKGFKLDFKLAAVVKTRKIQQDQLE